MSILGSFHNGFAPRDGFPLYPQLWRGCVGAWAPCLGQTGLTLRDWSGFNYHGTLTNMTAGSDWVISGGRQSLDFDGTDDIVIAPSLPTFSGDFTAQIWGYAYAADAGYDNVIFRSTNVFGGAARSGFTIVMRDAFTAISDRVGAEITDGTTRYHIESNVGVSRDTWLHLLCRRKNGVFSLWVNGIQQTATTTFSGAITNNTGTYLGAVIDYQGAGGTPMRRRIDDAMAWARGLADDEIRLLASRRGIAYDLSQRKRTKTFAGGFKAYWAARKAQIIGGGL